MMIINNIFEIGEIVYLKTDKEQLERIVYAFGVYKSGELLYKLSCGINTSEHYEFEISVEKNVLISSTN